MLNVTQLRAFVSVVEHGSFSEAARVMGLSQPAVTMQIQGLEADLGVTLLERRYRRVEMTEAGRTLLPYARVVLGQLEAAREEIEHLAGSVGGHLLLAASTTPGQYVLPRLLGTFLHTHPDAGVSLRVHDTAEVIELVESGEAHLGMTGAQMLGSRVVYEPVGTDSLVLVCAADSHLVGQAGLDLSDIAEEQFIMREEGSGTRMVFEDTLRAGGIDPADLRVVIELGTSEAIVNAVEGGMGVGVVSRWVAEKALKLGTIAEVAVPDFPVARPFYTVAPHGTLRHAAEALLLHLREQLG
ncbi:MAG TPA: selenium metabolism-associated LysR family transcriptional regulator [Coriobacteriia bacterium]